MKITCLNCDNVISLSENQVNKALETLDKKPEIKTLKLKCPVCKKITNLEPELFSQRSPNTKPSAQSDERTELAVTDKIEYRLKKDSSPPVYEFKKIYIPVDSVHEGEKIVESFDISTLQELGKSGWDIVTVVPRTFSQTFCSEGDGSFSKNTVFGAACGGNIMGVYFILRRSII